MPKPTTNASPSMPLLYSMPIGHGRRGALARVASTGLDGRVEGSYAPRTRAHPSWLIQHHIDAAYFFCSADEYQHLRRLLSMDPANDDRSLQELQHGGMRTLGQATRATRF